MRNLAILFSIKPTSYTDLDVVKMFVKVLPLPAKSGGSCFVC